MNVTILFGDREKKFALDEIVQRAHAAVDSVLERIRPQHATNASDRPIWHSVAMQIDCPEESEYARLMRAIEVNCALRRIAVMGVRRV
jgi:hypothetical protein